MSECLNIKKLQKVAKSLFAGRVAKRCVIIGSNPSLKKVELGQYVDSYDGDVIRINKLAHPDCTRNYGTRTDILFVCKWSDEHVKHEDFEPKIVVDDDLILDVSADFKGKNRPNLTTGMLCILFALQKYSHVELIGFGLPTVGESGQYKSVWDFDTNQNMDDPRFKHDINYEHALIWSLASNEYKGVLEILEWKNIHRRKNKCAFAMYARGDRYIAYQNNLESELRAYVPNADIVILDAEKAESYLPYIPEKSGRWNWDKSIFMRLAIPLMDDFKDYERVIWLDVDADIVSERFSGILNVETSDDGLAAVRDSGEAGLMKGFRRSFPDIIKSVYCNSGVLVMDLSKIDKEVWKDKIWKGIRKHLKDGLVFPDQDILNAFFDIKTIDDRFNTFFRDTNSWKNPWLIHYVAPSGKRKLDEIVKAKMARAKTRTTADAGNDPIDAVFVVGNGTMDCNQELRYALRSLDKNCKFVRNVYICGICPPWVDRSKVKFLPWPDRFQHAKDANIIDKLRHACEQDGIAKKILFCSDDQFQTRECTWEDFVPRFLFRFDPKDNYYESCNRVWRGRLRKTLMRDMERRKAIGMTGDGVYYYQPHIWMPIDRDLFIDYAKWCCYERREDTIIASGYYNFVDIRGVPNFDHIFLGADDTEIPKATHVAYHDGSYHAAIRILRKLFPSSCRFEKTMERNIAQSVQSISATSVPLKATGKCNGKDVKNEEYGKYDGYDPSPATPGEMAEVIEVSTNVRNNLAWNCMLGEISRAEELRLFGVRGWRVVWRDIIARIDAVDVTDIADNDVSIASRSDEAQRIVNAYISNPEAMRTVTFGPQAQRPQTPRGRLRERIRASLRMKTK